MTDSNTPSVTFALFAYNQEKYIRDAVQGALAQEYSPLQVIISDDSSTDDTFRVIQELCDRYEGPHSLIVNRNDRNLGIGAHVNRIMELSTGDVIVVAAGDDISLPGRTCKLVAAMRAAPQKAYSAWSSAIYIDDSGLPVDKVFRGNAAGYSEASMVRNLCPLIGATHAWHRDVFEIFGPLADGIVFEDNAISFRSFLLGDIVFCAEKLVKYRAHSENITNFTRARDHRRLYEAAARRGIWALKGIAQKIDDLQLVLKSDRKIERNIPLLFEELIRMRAITTRRLQAYQEYPGLSFRSAKEAFSDLEITKVVIRSIARRLSSSF